MKVEQILAGKGSAVFAVSDQQSIGEAVAVLNEKNIGAVVVRDASDGVVGILSERDVVRQVGKNGPGALSMKVSECMTPNPITCTAEASVNDLMTQMSEKRIRHLPVTQEGSIIGVVSIGDVVKRKIEEAEQEAQALKEYIAS